MSIDSFSPFVKKQINRYVREFSHYLYMRELEEMPSKFRRSKSLIEHNCRSGITKEVSFAIISGLNPCAYIDFDIVGGADKFDIAVGKHLKIDVTTANILSFNQHDENNFDMTFSLHISKLNSINKRSDGNLYIANEIAFLEQKAGYIYYLGRIKKDVLISLDYSVEQKRCYFAVKGEKIKPSQYLSNEIILT